MEINVGIAKFDVKIDTQLEKSYYSIDCKFFVTKNFKIINNRIM